MFRRFSIAVALILSACDSPVSPPAQPQPGAPVHVVIRDAVLRVLEGDSVRISLDVTDSAGISVSSALPTWTTSNWVSATVTDSGVVHSWQAGWTLLTARVGKSVDSVWVEVGKRFTSLAVGSGRACGVTAVNELYCWGASGRYSAVTITQGGSVATPLLIATDARAVTSGWDHTCRITLDNETHCWGSDVYGQRGDGTANSTFNSTTTAVRTPEPLIALTAGNYHTCGVSATQHVYCWGINDTGELGIWPDTRNPQSICSLACRDTAVLVPGLRLTSVSARLEHTCGLDASGHAFCWGANESGQLGSGTTGDTLPPTAVKTNLSFRAIAAGYRQTCAVASDGTLYCWGRNLGITPAATASSTKFKTVSTYEYSCAISTDDRLFCWLPGAAPAPLIPDVKIRSVEVNENLSCALAMDGGIYCWGRAQYSGTGLPWRDFPVPIAPPGPVPGGAG